MQLNPWSTPRPTVIVWMFFLTLSAVFVVGTCGLVTSSVSASTIKQTTITIKPQGSDLPPEVSPVAVRVELVLQRQLAVGSQGCCVGDGNYTPAAIVR